MGPREHRFPSVFEGGLPCERLSFQRLLRSVRQAIASRCRQGFGIEPLSAGAVERRVREYCVVRLSVRVHRPTGKRPSPLRAQGGKGRWWLGNARVPRLLDGDGAFGEVPQHAARERGSVSGPCAAPPHPRQRATRCIRTRNLLPNHPLDTAALYAVGPIREGRRYAPHAPPVPLEPPARNCLGHRMGVR